MLRRRGGFTLIELLVVIAIIGILAAMLFPVFARARESARKIQCLANVKNIALAYQMYLTDYDRFMPSLHDQRVVDILGSGCWMVKNNGNEPDPYLRIPVILDEYTKNRDIWRCPSGPDGAGFAINPCLPDWFTYEDSIGWCHICMNPFPNGWGGSVTDSYAQGQCAGEGSDPRSFMTNYATVRVNRDASTSQMGDAAKWVVVGDCSGNIERWHTYSFAYEACRIACQGETCGADWENCPSTRDCSIVPRGSTLYRTDANARRNTDGVRARHLGGNNLGFADGHAKWYQSETILWGGALPTGSWVEGSGPYMPPGDQFENVFNCRFPPVSEVP